MSVRVSGTEIYQEHKVWLYRWLRKRVFCPFRAEDLVQDTFCTLLSRKKLSEVREFRPLLYRIAHGLMVDDCRRKDLEKACLELLALETGGEAPSAEQVSAALQEIAWVESLLSGLSERTKDIFLMARLEDLPRKQIAMTLGVSLSTVEKELKLAMRVCYDRLYRDD